MSEEQPLFTPSGPPEIGEDEIQYLEKIGGGCFGSVYRGMCRGKEVAIKKLFKQDLSPAALKEFKKEVEICSSLHHPNVLLFMGACSTPGKMAIVMELMPKGNLEKYVHDPKRKLSLPFRLRMAKQCAQGMNWLHLSKPMIMHRDLKPSNLLVDSYGNVKVCDFGLSCIKPYGEKLKDTDKIPGTPLWMAPEVMMGRSIDEKADIYSFGIVLWEIATQKVPFPKMTSYPVFKRAICISNVRPTVPANLDSGLKNLLEVCWHHDPAERPTFAQIIKLLDIIIINTSIRDPEGRQFWKKMFLGKDQVEWEKFPRAFLSALGVKLDPEDIRYKCLKQLLAKEKPDSNIKPAPRIVSIEDFGNFLSFFPFSLKEKLPDTVKDLMANEWFHGDITREVAETRLSKEKKGGLFLVRLSTSFAGVFTLSKVRQILSDSKPQHSINHQRIDLTPEGYTIKIKKSGDTFAYTANTIPDLIKKVEGPLHLKFPCEGSVYYEELFTQREQDVQMAGYLVAYDNEDEDDDDEQQ